MRYITPYRLSRRRLLLGSATGMLPARSRPETEQEYRFETANYEIRMSLQYHDHEPNRELRFTERSANRRFCLSTDGAENRKCIDDFEGSVAVMRYRIRQRTAKHAPFSLREYVRAIDQSDYLPPRAPFERAIEVSDGRASDIQVYGYRLGSDREAGAPDESWCLLRQNLYLPDSLRPFLVLHWKHTFGAIRVLDIIPQAGTTAFLSGQPKPR